MGCTQADLISQQLHCVLEVTVIIHTTPQHAQAFSQMHSNKGVNQGFSSCLLPMLSHLAANRDVHKTRAPCNAACMQESMPRHKEQRQPSHRKEGALVVWEPLQHRA